MRREQLIEHYRKQGLELHQVEALTEPVIAKKMIPEADLDGIDDAILASARAWVGVDALTGEQIEPNRSVERKFSVIEYERRLRKRERREQEQRERELSEEDARLLDENEAKMKAQAKRWRLLPLIIQRAKPLSVHTTADDKLIM
jgi:hypothetical protein